MKYAFFPGCVIPTKVPQIESSSRAVFEVLGIEIVDGFNYVCCPNQNMKQLDVYSWLAIAARNLSIAEENKLDIITLCSGCANTLAEANYILRNDEERERINEILKVIDREYKGSVEVKHFLKVLHEDVGLEAVKNKVSKELHLKVAPYYGCHLLKPSKVMNFDDPENPSSMDELLKVLGCEPVSYLKSDMCCGSALGAIDENASLNMVKEILLEIKKVNADAISVVCPSCFEQLDLGQIKIMRRDKERIDVPVLYISQLMGLAMGIDSKPLGLTSHKVKPRALIARLSKE